MSRYIAFLRAINVGGHNVKMADLRRMFEELGFSNVETFIASGNVIFESGIEDAPALERQIEAHLRQSLGYEVATFLRSPEEVAAVANHAAFPTEDDAASLTMSIAFLPEQPDDAAQQALFALRTPIDDFHFHNREMYWLCRTKMSESTFSNMRLEKVLRMPATMRNITTVRKLAAKYKP